MGQLTDGVPLRQPVFYRHVEGVWEFLQIVPFATRAHKLWTAPCRVPQLTDGDLRGQGEGVYRRGIMRLCRK